MSRRRHDGDGAPAHGELPLRDYDHLPVGTLRDRIRTLDADQLEQVLGFERAHGDRPHVVEILLNRLTELQQGAAPSGGSPSGREPEVTRAPQATPPVSPRTAGPPSNPPSHGVPTNPAQPRK